MLYEGVPEDVIKQMEKYILKIRTNNFKFLSDDNIWLKEYLNSIRILILKYVKESPEKLELFGIKLKEI